MPRSTKTKKMLKNKKNKKKELSKSNILENMRKIQLSTIFRNGDDKVLRKAAIKLNYSKRYTEELSDDELNYVDQKIIETINSIWTKVEVEQKTLSNLNEMTTRQDMINYLKRRIICQESCEGQIKLPSAITGEITAYVEQKWKAREQNASSKSTTPVQNQLANVKKQLAILRSKTPKGELGFPRIRRGKKDTDEQFFAKQKEDNDWWRRWYLYSLKRDEWRKDNKNEDEYLHLTYIWRKINITAQWTDDYVKLDNNTLKAFTTDIKEWKTTMRRALNKEKRKLEKDLTAASANNELKQVTKNAQLTEKENEPSQTGTVEKTEQNSNQSLFPAYQNRAIAKWERAKAKRLSPDYISLTKWLCREAGVVYPELVYPELANDNRDKIIIDILRLFYDISNFEKTDGLSSQKALGNILFSELAPLLPGKKNLITEKSATIIMKILTRFLRFLVQLFSQEDVEFEDIDTHVNSMQLHMAFNITARKIWNKNENKDEYLKTLESFFKRKKNDEAYKNAWRNYLNWIEGVEGNDGDYDPDDKEWTPDKYALVAFNKPGIDLNIEVLERMKSVNTKKSNSLDKILTDAGISQETESPEKMETRLYEYMKKYVDKFKKLCIAFAEDILLRRLESLFVLFKRPEYKINSLSFVKLEINDTSLLKHINQKLPVLKTEQKQEVLGQLTNNIMAKENDENRENLEKETLHNSLPQHDDEYAAELIPAVDNKAVEGEIDIATNKMEIIEHTKGEIEDAQKITNMRPFLSTTFYLMRYTNEVSANISYDVWINDNIENLKDKAEDYFPNVVTYKWSKSKATTMMNMFLHRLLDETDYMIELQMKADAICDRLDNFLETESLDNYTNFFVSVMQYILGDESTTTEDIFEMLRKITKAPKEESNQYLLLFFLKRDIVGIIDYCKFKTNPPFIFTYDENDDYTTDNIDAIDFYMTLKTCVNEGQMTRNAREKLLNSDYKFDDVTKFNNFKITYNRLIKKTLEKSTLIIEAIIKRFQPILKKTYKKRSQLADEAIQELDAAIKENDTNTVLWTPYQQNEMKEMLGALEKKLGLGVYDMYTFEEDDADMLLYKDPLKNLLLNLRI